MDLSSIIGVVAGLVLVIFVGIGPSKIGNFWDPQSIAIVLGGTLAAVIASYPFSMLKFLWLFYETGILLCGPSWPQTHHVAQASLDPPASTSQMVGLPVCLSGPAL